MNKHKRKLNVSDTQIRASLHHQSSIDIYIVSIKLSILTVALIAASVWSASKP